MIEGNKQVNRLTIRLPVRSLRGRVSDLYRTVVDSLAKRAGLSQGKLDELLRSGLLSLASLFLFVLALKYSFMVLLIVSLSYFLLGSLTFALVVLTREDQ